MFKEFSNPEEKDYDITSSINNIEEKNINSYVNQLINLIGFLEDGEWINYGITEEEYMNPTKETIEKIENKLNEMETKKIR